MGESPDIPCVYEVFLTMPGDYRTIRLGLLAASNCREALELAEDCIQASRDDDFCVSDAADSDATFIVPRSDACVLSFWEKPKTVPGKGDEECQDCFRTEGDGLVLS